MELEGIPISMLIMVDYVLQLKLLRSKNLVSYFPLFSSQLKSKIKNNILPLFTTSNINNNILYRYILLCKAATQRFPSNHPFKGCPIRKQRWWKRHLHFRLLRWIENSSSPSSKEKHILHKFETVPRV